MWVPSQLSPVRSFGLLLIIAAYSGPLLVLGAICAIGLRGRPAGPFIGGRRPSGRQHARPRRRAPRHHPAAVASAIVSVTGRLDSFGVQLISRAYPGIRSHDRQPELTKHAGSISSTWRGGTQRPTRCPAYERVLRPPVRPLLAARVRRIKRQHRSSQRPPTGMLASSMRGIAWRK